MSKVSIVRCGDYDYVKVKDSVRSSLDLLGGIKEFVSPGDRVLLKVNLLMRRKPEKVTTTHPSVVRALAELILEAGAYPIIGDSPGGYHYYSRNTLEAVYETCGMREAAESSEAGLNFNTEIVEVPYPEGKLMKSIKTIMPVLEVDRIINIPKIKTHAMMVYSGAVKNLFGVIPGRYKPEYHLRFEDTGDFADVLIDICSFVRPVLTVMDAVVGMQGYGPTNGTPKNVGLIIAGADPYELDVVASGIIGLKPGQVPTIKRSMERGLCSGNIKDIDVVGERIGDVFIDDFKIPTVKLSLNFYNLIMPRFISKRLNRVMKAKPCFNLNVCKSCGMCAGGCPPKAIDMVAGKPVLNIDKCIRCFCCHELCNYNAVEIKRPWWLRMLLQDREHS